ncbi:uncharacterized protein BJ171DRAFT_163291 [Polychytrium aggregatum]|uniref:uncharacterized protein n=1 Tax=Polychytrium aggregatum TaxID=110093 RepID=UPI0022FED416|nr:uncharacterized protein BJ171DRAFT_163291 [Polychytrium aggregatum]KAI9202890.1 hypothetical protein BJ171DRAFT_163291 [Polychytrium aggregatum]
MSRRSLLDLLFLLDCTASMGPYIAKATESINTIVETIANAEQSDVIVGLISYRDHPPQDLSYVTRCYPFTSSIPEMKTHLAMQRPQGGGDGPEAVTAALNDALKMNWRPNSTKVLVLIADAPPHGIGERHDGFPDGDPHKVDPLVVARQLQQLGVCIYSVVCEPAISQKYQYAVDFYKGLSRITGGSMVPLTSAELLPDVIVGGAQEQMNLARLSNQVEMAVRTEVNDGVMTEDDLIDRLFSKMSISNVVTKQLKVDDPYVNIPEAEHNATVFANSFDLAAARSHLKAVSTNRLRESYTYSATSGGYDYKRSTDPAYKHHGSGVFGGYFGSYEPRTVVPPPISRKDDSGADVTFGEMETDAERTQSVRLAEEAISYEQVRRLVRQVGVTSTAIPASSTGEEMSMDMDS